MADPLARLLIRTWEDQIGSGFILGDPHAPVETRLVPDPVSGVTFRLRWLPHRRLRTDTSALESRGILNPDRDEAALVRDPRDPSGRHCFLCPANVRVCHPLETLLPIQAGGRSWFAGANFAWLAQNHFTVMANEHVDQLFDRSIVDAMLDMQEQTAGEFRIVFNGSHAGATIPWHLHLQITTDPFPVEAIAPDRSPDYPTPLQIIVGSSSLAADVTDFVAAWQELDLRHHRVNLVVSLRDGSPIVFVFLRDTRVTVAGNKGLMGGWEVAGDFVYSDRRPDFETADIDAVRAAYAEIRPPATPSVGRKVQSRYR